MIYTTATLRLNQAPLAQREGTFEALGSEFRDWLFLRTQRQEFKGKDTIMRHVNGYLSI
jgi:hypothetical protein